MGTKRRTGISWTEATWNPVTGCTRVSEGCRHCYASTLHNRRYKANTLAARRHPAAPTVPTIFATNQWTTLPEVVRNANLPPALPFPDTYDTPFAAVRCHEGRLEIPLRRRKPTTYFTCSMGDLFHQDVPAAFLDRVFAVMAFSPRHTYQVLTKRPERMRAYLTAAERAQTILTNALEHHAEAVRRGDLDVLVQWALNGAPLPNVQLGVSVESPEHLARITELLATPAALRFLSAEPLLAPLDLSPYLPWVVGVDGMFTVQDVQAWTPAQRKEAEADRIIVSHPFEPSGRGGVGEFCATCGNYGAWPGHRPKLGWVIVGGESGPGHRPMDHAWLRGIVDQCRAAGVPVFVKQDAASRPGVTATLPAELRIQEFPLRRGSGQAAVADPGGADG